MRYPIFTLFEWFLIGSVSKGTVFSLEVVDSACSESGQNRVPWDFRVSRKFEGLVLSRKSAKTVNWYGG